VLRGERRGVRVYAVEPSASPVLAGGPPDYHHIQGIGAGFVPEILNTRVYDEVIGVSDEEAVKHTRALARFEGLLVGISSGAACAAAIGVARKLGRGSLVLTVFPDTGERYLTTDLFHAEGI
jgi:cysteine synthase A